MHVHLIILILQNSLYFSFFGFLLETVYWPLCSLFNLGHFKSLVQSRPLSSYLCSIWVYLFRLSILLLSSTFQKWKQIIFRKKINPIFLWEIIFWPRGLFFTRVGEGETNIFLILALYKFFLQCLLFMICMILCLHVNKVMTQKM